MEHVATSSSSAVVTNSSSSAGSRHSNLDVLSEASLSDGPNKLQGQVGWLMECLDCHQASATSAAAQSAHNIFPATSSDVLHVHQPHQQLWSPPQSILSHQATAEPEAPTAANGHIQSHLEAQQLQDARPGPANALLSSADQAAADPAPELSEHVNRDATIEIAQPVSSTASYHRSDAASTGQGSPAALPSERVDGLRRQTASPSVQPLKASDLTGDAEAGASGGGRQAAESPQAAAADGIAVDSPAFQLRENINPLAASLEAAISKTERDLAGSAATSWPTPAHTDAADPLQHAGDPGRASNCKEACAMDTSGMTHVSPAVADHGTEEQTTRSPASSQNPAGVPSSEIACEEGSTSRHPASPSPAPTRPEASPLSSPVVGLRDSQQKAASAGTVTDHSQARLSADSQVDAAIHTPPVAQPPASEPIQQAGDVRGRQCQQAGHAPAAAKPASAGPKLFDALTLQDLRGGQASAAAQSAAAQLTAPEPQGTWLNGAGSAPPGSPKAAAQPRPAEAPEKGPALDSLDAYLEGAASISSIPSS